MPSIRVIFSPQLARQCHTANCSLAKNIGCRALTNSARELGAPSCRSFVAMAANARDLVPEIHQEALQAVIYATGGGMQVINFSTAPARFQNACPVLCRPVIGLG